MFKLRQNGIEGKLLEWLNSYLSQRKQKVCIKSCFSDLKSIFAGVLGVCSWASFILSVY